MSEPSHFNFQEIAAEVRTLRRVIYLGCVIALTLLGVLMLFDIFIVDGLTLLEVVMLPLFCLLFSQISIGFTLAVIGFVQMVKGGDPIEIMRTLPPVKDEEDIRRQLAGTAITVPVYNEDISRVLAAVESMLKQLRAQGAQEFFDIFLLSDSNNPDTWVREETAWLDFCRRNNAFGKVFYRKRRVPLKAKSGNIADFCRRWGKRYRYMMVLDADSVMSARTMIRLVRAMELNPRVGLIQTPPTMVLGQTLFRRMFQFIARLCAPLFTAGSHFWQLGGGNFWGHNAIIRLAPFMEHCGLPDLPEPERGKRHIMSHDTVEAALMKQAGYEVWLALEEEGSYEEGPPNLTDMLKRDRRWCQGNLQHFWFLFARNVDFSNRLHIWKGLMSYGSSPLWFLFLVLSALDAFRNQRTWTLAAMPAETFGNLDISAVQLLLFFTLGLLFTPKILGYLLALPRARQFGGILRMSASLLLETLCAILIAPVLMLFHTRFVLMTLLGVKVKWSPQNRDGGNGLSFAECIRTYGWVFLVGLGSGVLSALYLPEYFVWFSPIFTSWLLAIPVAWITSKPGLGRACRELGLFLIPEDVTPPPELAGLHDAPATPDFWPPPAHDAARGIVQAILNPYVHAIHLSLLRQKTGRKPAGDDSNLGEVVEKLKSAGPGSLTREEEMKLLWNPDVLAQLHDELWKSPLSRLHASWAPCFAQVIRRGS